MARQVAQRRMMQTGEIDRLRFHLVAAEFLLRMGARIRERREELGLSRGDVVEQMPGRVSENQLYRWEKGLHQPHPDSLEALAVVLKCDVAQFVAKAPDQGQTPDPFSSTGPATQLDRIERQVSELYDLLLGDGRDAKAVAGVAARLLRAAGLPPPKADAPAKTPPAAQRRKRA